MTKDPRHLSKAVDSSLAHRWSPVRATLFAVSGAYLAAGAVFQDASDSTFEFWARILFGVALVALGLEDLRHQREVRESRTP